jgi:hypothetical protein
MGKKLINSKAKLRFFSGCKTEEVKLREIFPRVCSPEPESVNSK